MVSCTKDIAARNLLVDPGTDALMLFDFKYSGRIGGIGHVEDRDDVKGVIFTLYEIVTRDEHFREVPHERQEPADVEGLGEWVKHPDVKLDHPVSEYRSVLDEWVKKRRDGRKITIYTEAPEYIDWPLLADPPKKTMMCSADQGNPIAVSCSGWSGMRRDEREKGGEVLNWERPPQIKLGNGTCLLANGQFVGSI